MRILFAIIIILIFDSCINKNENYKEIVKMENISQLDKISEMLDEDLFWQIIDKSLNKTSNPREQEKFLIKEISKLPLKDIIGFRLRTDKLLYETYTSEMWCAGYLMNHGCSDDDFEYFRNWIISRGKGVYNKAKTNPDSLINQLDNTVYGFYEFEAFWYVALEAFQLKTGKNLYDYIDYEKFKTTESNYPIIEFTWEEGKPETMKAICPKLFSNF